MKRRKGLDVLLICLKILIPILIAIPLVFFSFRLVESRLTDIAERGNESYHSGTGLFIFLSHVCIFAANIVITVIAGAGLLVSGLYKGAPKRHRNIVTFVCLTCAPFWGHLLYVLFNIIVMNLIK